MSAREELRRIAHQAMIDRGLLPEFSAAAIAGAGRLAEQAGAAPPADGARDLRGLLWASIDNDDSRDLDQLSVAEALPSGLTRILVAIADVDAKVGLGSSLDGHASANTTSVYTDAQIFRMLPEVLSTDLTSLNEGRERQAIVFDMQVDGSGQVTAGQVYRAIVVNRAKLAYNGVAAWLDGHAGAPPKVTAVAGLADNLRLQDRVAQALRGRRHQRGALDLETLEPRAIFDGDAVGDLQLEQRDRAKELIEDFMIAANVTTARFLEGPGLAVVAACASFARTGSGHVAATRGRGAPTFARGGRCPGAAASRRYARGRALCGSVCYPVATQP